MKTLGYLGRTILATVLLVPLTSSGAGCAEAKMPTAKIGGNSIKLEVAESEREIEHGLMFRTALPEDQGMVFLFHPPRPVSFWMCHTLIPLDMLFVNNGKIVKIFHNVPPCKSPDCTDCVSYPSGKKQDISEVIEVNGGYSKRHEVHEGDAVDIELK